MCYFGVFLKKNPSGVRRCETAAAAVSGRSFRLPRPLGRREAVTVGKELFGKDVPIVRVMPNTAIAIRESMTCLATDSKDMGVLEEIKEVFDLLGTTLVITERLMSAATILGACGIAYFLRYIRAASQGGIQVGFNARQAQLIAAQTAKGAASLLLQKGNHPEDEIDKVTTPRGCTIAGLNEMEHFGLSSAVIKGIITSFKEIEKLK